MKRISKEQKEQFISTRAARIIKQMKEKLSTLKIIEEQGAKDADLGMANSATLSMLVDLRPLSHLLASEFDNDWRKGLVVAWGKTFDQLSRALNDCNQIIIETQAPYDGPFDGINNHAYFSIWKGENGYTIVGCGTDSVMPDFEGKSDVALHDVRESVLSIVDKLGDGTTGSEYGIQDMYLYDM